MMPDNLLVIGNSHVVALRLALRDNPDRWADLGATFFALPPAPLRQLSLQDGHLLPDTVEAQRHMRRLNGTDQLALAGYDAFLIVGGPAFSAVAQLQRSHRSLDFPSVAAGQPCDLISTGYMDAMIRHRVRYSAALKLARMLESLQEGPVLLAEAPLPSEECRDDPAGLEHYLQMIQRGDAAHFWARYRQALQDVAGAGVTVVPQPPQTIADDFFTARDWMRGSFGLGRDGEEPHQDRDYHHANPGYGGLQLDLLMKALAAL